MTTVAQMESYYASLAPKVTNCLVAGGCDYAQACDIVQETFLRLWKMRDSLSEDPSQVSGLAFTVAKNLRKDKLRKSAHEVLQEEIRESDGTELAEFVRPGVAKGGVPQAELPASADDRAFLRRRLQEAFATLPPLLREAYVLFQVQELPIREIARRINASESLVKVRIFRAKEKLRPLLQDLL